MRPKRIHHVDVVLPTLQAVEHLMNLFSMEVDCQEYVEPYKADLIFT
ncbi:MAG TPA: hypothetical protein VMT53_23960 [Terriglobales bacterium]|nr:hypothetical protein [Terriglobales bacterium]